jgi:hypothetical protein
MVQSIELNEVLMVESLVCWAKAWTFILKPIADVRKAGEYHPEEHWSFCRHVPALASDIP